MIESTTLLGFWVGYLGVVSVSTIWAVHARSYGAGALRYWGGNFAGVLGLAWVLSYLA